MRFLFSHAKIATNLFKEGNEIIPMCFPIRSVYLLQHNKKWYYDSKTFLGQYLQIVLLISILWYLPVSDIKSMRAQPKACQGFS